MAAAAIGSTGGNQPISIVQPYLCVNFIIALQGIFPSRG
jgi:microcystin-dependent protein